METNIGVMVGTVQVLRSERLILTINLSLQRSIHEQVGRCFKKNTATATANTAPRYSVTGKGTMLVRRPDGTLFETDAAGAARYRKNTSTTPGIPSSAQIAQNRLNALGVANGINYRNQEARYAANKSKMPRYANGSPRIIGLNGRPASTTLRAPGGVRRLG